MMMMMDGLNSISHSDRFPRLEVYRGWPEEWRHRLGALSRDKANYHRQTYGLLKNIDIHQK